MAFYFDKKRKIVELKNKVYIHLTRKSGHNGYKMEGSTVFLLVKMGPFPIKKDEQAKPPPELRLHPIITPYIWNKHQKTNGNVQ
jgi:hypothetical protein